MAFKVPWGLNFDHLAQDVPDGAHQMLWFQIIKEMLIYQRKIPTQMRKIYYGHNQDLKIKGNSKITIFHYFLKMKNFESN